VVQGCQEARRIGVLLDEVAGPLDPPADEAPVARVVIDDEYDWNVGIRQRQSPSRP
jgi:hypothetical protein